MSRAIKSVLTRHNALLTTALNEMDARIQNPRRLANEPLDMALNRLHAERTIAKIDLEKIQGLIDRINHKDNIYQDLLIHESQEVEDPANRVENLAYDIYLQNTPYLDTLAEAEYKVPALNGLISTYDQSIEALEREEKRVNPDPLLAPANAGQILSIEKVSLKPFSGKMRDFPEFWDRFKHTVHERAYPNTDKLVVLKSLMGGDAKGLLDDLMIEDGNYQIAVDKIKYCFDDQNALKMTLYNDLENLPLYGNDVRNLRKSLDEIQRILRQLEKAGEDTNQRSTILMVEKKWPMFISFRILDKKAQVLAEARPWTMSNLIQELESLIKLRESVQQVSNISGEQAIKARNSRQKLPSPASGQKILQRYNAWSQPSPPIRQGQPSNSPGFMDESESFFNLGKSSKGWIPKFHRPCNMCQGTHFTLQCPKFVTHNDRRNFLISNGRCPDCDGEKHTAPDEKCNRQVLCRRCKTPGHIGLLCKQLLVQLDRDLKKKFIHERSTLLAKNEGKANVHVINFDETVPYELQALDLEDIDLYDIVDRDESFYEAPNLEECDDSSRDYGLDAPEDNHMGTIFSMDQQRNCPSSSMPINSSQLELQVGLIRSISPTPAPVEQLSEDESFAQLSGCCNSGPQESVTQEHVIQTRSFLSCDRVKVATPHFASIKEAAIVFYDSGCVPYNRISDALAQKLQLVVRPTLVSINTFGSINSEVRETNVVSDNLGMSDGSWYPLECNTIDSIAGKNIRTILTHPERDKFNPESDFLSIQEVKPDLDQVALGIIEECPLKTAQGRVRYNPYHGGYSSNTTKLRVVNDASATATPEIDSLNDLLFRGPVTLPEVAGLHIRFRLNSIVVCVDIEKVFWQIELNLEDRDSTRFLWVRNPGKPPEPPNEENPKGPRDLSNLVSYRFKRVPFGVISSPFLLAGVILFHVKEHPGIQYENTGLGLQPTPVYDPEQKGPERRYPIRSTQKKMELLFCIALLFMYIRYTSGNKIPIITTCTKQGVDLTIEHGVQLVTACLGHYCLTQHLPGPKMNVTFPVEARLYTQLIEVSYWEKENTTSNSYMMECPPISICDVLECTFCSSFLGTILGNPKCAPGTVFTIVVIVNIVATIFIIWCATKTFSGLKGIVAILRKISVLSLELIHRIKGKSKIQRRSRQPRSNIRVKSNTTVQMDYDRFLEAELLRPEGSSNSPPPPYRSPTAPPMRRNNLMNKIMGIQLAIFLFFSLVGRVHCLDRSEVESFTVGSESCYRNGTHSICTVNTALLITVPPHGQTACMMGTDSTSGKPIGTLEIKFMGIEAIGKPVFHHFTRDFHLKHEAVKLCAHSGSCVTDKCATVKPDDVIPEFDHITIRHGYLRCTESCGWFSCGCGWPTAGCLFYETYLEETSDRSPYAVYQYSFWSLEAILETNWISNNHSKKEIVVIHPGETWKNLEGNFKITLLSEVIPHTSLLDHYFMFNGTNTALLNSRAYENSKIVRCKDEKTARNMDCVFDPTACNCLPAENEVNCDCRKSIFKERFETSLLPTHTPFVTLEESPQHFNHLLAKYEQDSAVQLSGKMVDLKLINLIDETLCHVEADEGKGCFDCDRGFEVKMKCRSDHDGAVAQVSCSPNTFYLTCNKEPYTQIKFLAADSPDIKVECIVSCSKGNTSFELVAHQLEYHGASGLPSWDSSRGGKAQGPLTTFRSIMEAIFSWFFTSKLLMGALIVLVGTSVLITWMYCWCQRKTIQAIAKPKAKRG